MVTAQKQSSGFWADPELLPPKFFCKRYPTPAIPDALEVPLTGFHHGITDWVGLEGTLNTTEVQRPVTDGDTPTGPGCSEPC